MNYSLLSLLSAITLVGCVSVEPVNSPPHINLSPAEMRFLEADGEGQLDFGLDLARNESDSLENLEVLPGLRVRSVRRGSAAEVAGIRSGDILLAVDGVETNEPDAIAAIAAASANDIFLARLRRGTTVYEATIPRPQQRTTAAPRELYRVDPLRSRAGYATELVSLDGEEQRTVIRIAEIRPGSPLTDAGLEAGDLILRADGLPVTTAQALVNELHRRPFGSRLNLSIIDQSEARPAEVRVRLWEPERRLSSLALWPLFTFESSIKPERVKVAVLDFVLFSLVTYQREQGERNIRLLGLVEFGTGYGELVEEIPPTER